jgi:hypothetical protein
MLAAAPTPSRRADETLPCPGNIIAFRLPPIATRTDGAQCEWKPRNRVPGNVRIAGDYDLLALRVAERFKQNPQWARRDELQSRAADSSHIPGTMIGTRKLLSVRGGMRSPMKARACGFPR